MVGGSLVAVSLGRYHYLTVNYLLIQTARAAEYDVPFSFYHGERILDRSHTGGRAYHRLVKRELPAVVLEQINGSIMRCAVEPTDLLTFEILQHGALYLIRERQNTRVDHRRVFVCIWVDYRF